ncbi:MAG: Crp/Fnr family transcriptional regulator [Bacteroidota bacterium]
MTFKEELFENLKTLYKETTGHKIQLVKNHDVDQYVYRYGEIPKGIYYISSGSVKVARQGTNGREVILRVAQSHDFIGYLSLLQGWSYKTSAICLEKSEIYFIAKTIFLKSIEADPQFGYKVIEMLCDRVYKSDNAITGLATKSVRERLCMTLLTLDRTTPSFDEIGVVKFKRKDIAAMIGTIPETISRQLNELEKAGLIINHEKHIEIINREELTKIGKLGD